MSHISENLEWQEGAGEICLNPSLHALVSNQNNSEYNTNLKHSLYVSLLGEEDLTWKMMTLLQTNKGTKVQGTAN